MKIRLTKLSDLRHRLEIRRFDDTCEQADLVTRECLFHDFVHFAVEAAMPTQGGFWGALASGARLSELNDRDRTTTMDGAATLYAVEAAVGMTSGVLKGNAAPEAMFRSLCRMFESQAQVVPHWCNERFVAEVSARMRSLLGHWRATPFGETLELDWSEPERQPKD